MWRAFYENKKLIKSLKEIHIVSMDVNTVECIISAIQNEEFKGKIKEIANSRTRTVGRASEEIKIAPPEVQTTRGNPPFSASYSPKLNTV